MFRRVLATAALSFAALGVLVTPSAAASKPNPCKLLKTSEIAQQFGGATVSTGKAGFATAITKSCEFAVAESANLPDGSVHVNVMTTGGKIAYDAHKKKPEFGYVPATGMSNALWSDKTHALEALKGTTLVTVQPVFISVNPLPVHQLDTEAQAVALLKLALKRA
jgi:hypothetical protein